MSSKVIKFPELRFPEFEGEWEEKRLKKVLELKPRPFKMGDDEEYSLVTVKRRFGGVVSRGKYFGRDIKVKSQFTLKSNDFLISKRQISHKAFGIVPQELDGSIVSNEYSVFIPQDNLDIYYFNHYCRRPSVSYTFFLSSIGVHIEKMLFHVEDWLKRKFYFPVLAEQQKIVSFLSDVDTKIEKLSRKKELLEQYKKGIMQKLFSREIQFKDENGEEFPEWEEKRLGEVAEIFDGTHQTPNYVATGIPFYSVEHLTSNNFRNTKYISNEAFKKESRRVILERNDILMTRIGDIGTCKLIDWDVQASFYVSLALIKCHEPILPTYIAHFINSRFFQRELHHRTIHVAFPKKINLGEISNCKVLIPNTGEQHKIAVLLTNLDTLIDCVAKEISSVKEFKKGLLQGIFV